MACLTDNQFQDLPEEDWSPYHHRIWDSFEGLVDELMRGEPEVPHQYHWAFTRINPLF